MEQTARVSRLMGAELGLTGVGDGAECHGVGVP